MPVKYLLRDFQQRVAYIALFPMEKLLGFNKFHCAVGYSFRNFVLSVFMELYAPLAIRNLIANRQQLYHGWPVIFKGLSQDGGRADFSPRSISPAQTAPVKTSSLLRSSSVYLQYFLVLIFEKNPEKIYPAIVFDGSK
jgi:hypothetical protein